MSLLYGGRQTSNLLAWDGLISADADMETRRKMELQEKFQAGARSAASH